MRAGRADADPFPSGPMSRLTPASAAAIAAVLLAVPNAGAQTKMLRTPSVSATHIAFAYGGDVWIVDRAGGAARRLTTGGGESCRKLSPDGRWVAFRGDEGGNTDVYVVPAEGGEPKRLTWQPAPDVVQGW